VVPGVVLEAAASADPCSSRTPSGPTVAVAVLGVAALVLEAAWVVLELLELLPQPTSSGASTIMKIIGSDRIDIERNGSGRWFRSRHRPVVVTSRCHVRGHLSRRDADDNRARAPGKRIRENVADDAT
jgi:hypothetical protein